MEESYNNEEVCRSISKLVDPRMAAEFVSTTELQCIFKGLQHSPQIITDPVAMKQACVLTATDVSCLIIPENCLGLPVLAALEQGIQVIAVKDNKNLMKSNEIHMEVNENHICRARPHNV